VVVGSVHLDGAVEMHRPIAVLVVAERLDGKRQQVGLLFSEHRRDLALRRAVDPGVGPVRLPAVEVGLSLLEALEAKTSQLALRVVHARLDLPLAIGVAHTAGQRRHAVVREHVAVQRVQRRLVDVGLEHALFEIIQNCDARGSTQAAEGALMELRPDL
jgi:hypothetical protein